MVAIRFTVNGKEITDQVDGQLSLLGYLRGHLGLTGAKMGCRQGGCGACTVLVNGRPRKSCVLKLNQASLKNAAIETIEGLAADDGALYPIQESFVYAGALQCGFCTPGMVMTVKGLLDANPAPTRQEIKRYISPRNLCRCTGYQKIFQAVEEAARVMRGEASRLNKLADDAPLWRQEAMGKVTGSLAYAADIRYENMLHGKVLFSAHPHAVVKKIDTRAARSVAGVAAVFTAEEIPGSLKIGMIDRDQPALAGLGDVVRSVADPLCAVFAETEAAAREALAAVVVEYEVLQGVFNPEDAAKQGAPRVWPDKPGNLFFSGVLARADIDEALGDSDLIVAGEFSTSRVVHGYMEPETGLARPDGRGGVVIYYPTQSVFDDQAQVAEVLGLPREKVRVIQLPTGGAFGGKEDVIFHHLLALAALKLNRPVKISLLRETSLRVTQKKHPARFKLQLGLDRKGTFKGLSAEISTDKGAYATLGHDIIENMMAFIGGPYHIPAVRINGRSWHTHNVMSGAMRGFGANQSNFAIESLIDMAARKTGLDPFEIRLKNALSTGLPTVAGHVLEPGVAGVVEVIEALEKAVRAEQAPKAPQGTRLGFGMACGVKNIGFGHSLPESAGAKVVLAADGACRLYVTHHEYGQGATIGQVRIVAETLGIPLDSISVHGPDTAKTPYTGATTASRQTFLSGNATLGACRQLLSDLLPRAAQKMGVADPAALAIEGDGIIEKGKDNRLPLRGLGNEFTAEFRAFAPETQGFPGKAESGRSGSPRFKSHRTHWAYAYGAQAAWVAVDPETGRVQVLKIVTVGDVGKVLNRRAVEGQQEGGVMMGVGYALSEEFEVANGINTTQTLAKCGLPRAAEAPEIVSVAVEVSNPWGPLGLKGLAEAPSLATAPAIANAICDATGLRMRDLPITKAKLKKTRDESRR